MEGATELTSHEKKREMVCTLIGNHLGAELKGGTILFSSLAITESNVQLQRDCNKVRSFVLLIR